MPGPQARGQELPPSERLVDYVDERDLDHFAAALARLLLSAARVNGRPAATAERTTDQEAAS